MPKTYPRFFAEKFRGYGWLDTEKVSEQASALSEPLPPSSNWIVARSKVITWSENKVQTFRHLIVTSSEIVLFRGSHLFSPAQVDLVMPALDIKGILLDKKLVQINNWVISLPDKEMAQYFFDLIKYMRHSPFTEQAQDLSSGEQNSSPQSNVAPASTLVSADELSSQSSTEDRKPSNLSLHWYTGLGWTALVAVINFVAQVMIFSLLPPEAVCLTLLLMIGVPVGFLILLRRRKARALANPSNTKT